MRVDFEVGRRHVCVLFALTTKRDSRIVFFRYTDNRPSIQDKISKSNISKVHTWMNFSNTKVPNADTQYVSRALITIFSM